MPQDGQAGFGADAMAFGMMNSLRTGNPHQDMLVVVLVPLVMAVVAGVVENARPMFGRGYNKLRQLGGLQALVERH